MLFSRRPLSLSLLDRCCAQYLILCLCSLQCAVLSLLLPNKVYYPTSQGYKNTTSSYYSAFEDELSPGCVVRPTKKLDISLIIKTLKSLSKLKSCQLAIKGGGHTPFAGSANIDGGVTLDLESFTGVDVNTERTLTSIGAGERWGNLYGTLDPLGLTVVGGRTSAPGVAGLTLGGQSMNEIYSPEYND